MKLKEEQMKKMGFFFSLKKSWNVKEGNRCPQLSKELSNRRAIGCISDHKKYNTMWKGLLATI